MRGHGIATRAGGIGTLRTRRIGGHLLRSALNLTTMISFYYALRLLPLADSIAINFAAPLFVTALSGPMLGEHVGIRRWIAVAFGFAGVLLAVQPSPSGISLGAGLALLSGLCWALTIVTSRQISGTESSHTILFYYSLAVVVALGATMPSLWIEPSFHDWIWFIVVGISGSFGQFCYNQAFRYGEASMVAPLDYLSIVWATLFGFTSSATSRAGCLGGAACIIASSIYIARREAMLARRGAGADEGTCDARDVRRRFPLRGMLYMGAGVFCMSVVDAVSKQLVGGYSLAQIMFFTRLTAPFFAIALAMAQGGLLTLGTRRMGWHVLRGIVSAATGVTFVASLRLLALADAVAITFVSPLLMSALSVPMLRERVGPRRWAAILVGLSAL